MSIENDPQLMASAAKLCGMTAYEFQRHLEDERIQELNRRREHAESMRPLFKYAAETGYDCTPYVMDDGFMMKVWRDEQQKAGNGK
jgi:hypothetical protein